MNRTPMPPRRTGLRRLTALRPVSTRRRRQARVQAVVKAAALERDGYRCVLAGVDDAGACWGPLDAHHLVKQSAGGDDSLDNEVTLCRHHNGWVEDHPKAARRLGLVRYRPVGEPVSWGAE